VVGISKLARLIDASAKRLQFGNPSDSHARKSDDCTP
jgi:hypothetical protein